MYLQQKMWPNPKIWKQRYLLNDLNDSNIRLKSGLIQTWRLGIQCWLFKNFRVIKSPSEDIFRVKNNQSSILLQNPKTTKYFLQESLYCHSTDHNPPLSSSGVLDSPPPPPQTPHLPPSPPSPLPSPPSPMFCSPDQVGQTRLQRKCEKTMKTLVEILSNSFRGSFLYTQFWLLQPTRALLKYQISLSQFPLDSELWLELVQSGDGTVRNWAAPVI